MLCGKHAKQGTVTDDYIYVGMNMFWFPVNIEVPMLPPGMNWHVSVNTGMASPDDIHEPGTEPALGDQHNFYLDERSICILVGR